MTLDLPTFLSVISVTVAVCAFFANGKRTKSQDDRKDASEMTTVIVKLETIGDGIKEIKGEIQNMKDEIRLDHDVLIKVQESAKQAHKRLDEMQTQINSLVGIDSLRGHLPTE